MGIDAFGNWRKSGAFNKLNRVIIELDEETMIVTVDMLNACCEVCGKYTGPRCATCPIEVQRQALVNEAMRDQSAIAEKKVSA